MSLTFRGQLPLSGRRFRQTLGAGLRLFDGAVVYRSPTIGADQRLEAKPVLRWAPEIGTVMGYQPTFSSLLTEITVSITFSFALLNAWGQGRRWFSTVFWGALAGYGAEYAIVHSANPRYHYGTHLFWASPLDVPICIGLGWGVVFYAATWTAQRLRIKSIATSSLIAGVLGANIDLSLDPVAPLHDDPPAADRPTAHLG